MTTRTDLTEHRDFGAPSEIQVSRIIAEEALELANERMMSTEEFEKIYAWEEKFGRKHHSTEDIEIFGRSNNEWMMEIGHCQRCGKTFRIPWKRVHDLCPECNSLEKRHMPWEQEAIGNRNFPTDIFRLR